MNKPEHSNAFKTTAIIIALVFCAIEAAASTSLLWFNPAGILSGFHSSVNYSNGFQWYRFPINNYEVDSILQIECPAGISTYTDLNECTADISGSLNAAVTSGVIYRLIWEMDGATLDESPGTGINQIGSHVFNEGTTIVTYTATDRFKNVVNCSFTVIVSDNQVPKFVTVPENITVSADSAECGAHVTWPEPAVTDNCTPPGKMLKTATHSSGDYFPLGTTQVTYTIDDGMATTRDSHSFTVTVIDKTSPVLTTPESVTINCNEKIPQLYTTLQSFTVAGGSVTDNCTLAPATFKFAGQTQSGHECPYTLTRTYSIADIYGNVSNAEHLIFVQEEPVNKEVVTLKSGMADITLVNSGNWNVASNWNTGTVPILTDNVTIPGTLSVTIDAASECKNITILAGGTVNHSGATTLKVYGDWSNSGTYNGGTNGVVEFAGAGTANISGATTFKNLTINKGTDRSNLLNVNSSITVTGNFVPDNGLFVINNGATVNCTFNTGFTIKSGAGIQVNGGILTTGSFSITNDGLFKVSAGSTVNLGDDLGNSIQTRGGATLQMDGGTLNIAGRLVNTAGNINITGGTINLNTVGHNSSTIATLDLSLSTVFIMSGGTIVFHKPNGTGNLDIDIVNSTGSKNIMGGTFVFGTSAITSGSIFKVNSVAAFNDLTLYDTKNLKLVAGTDLTINGTLALNDGIIDSSFGNKYIIITNPLLSALSFNTGFIQGKLQRNINDAGVNYAFPIGTGSASSIIHLNFASITAPGYVTASSAGNLPSGFLLNSATATRQVFITNNTVGFTTVSGSYQLPSGFNASQKAGLFNGAWSYQPASASVFFSGWNNLSGSVFALADCIPPTITLGADQTICEGAASVNLPYTATTNSPKEYQIDFAENSLDITWTPLPVSPINIAIPIGTAPDSYLGNLYVRNAADCESNVVAFSIILNPVSVGGLVSGGTTICSGSTSGLLTLSGHTGTVVKWQSSVSPFNIWTDISNTATTYTSGALTQTTQFRAEVKSGVCTSVLSSAATVTVNQKSSDPTSATASATTIFYGQSTSLILNGGGSGTGAVIRWYAGSCGGTLVGTGNNLTVTPSATTIYYGRYEDPPPCNSHTICQSVLITVTDRFTISKSITQTPSNPGDAFSYQISYLNLNTSVTATGVIIKDVLPAANYFTYVSSSPAYTSFNPATRQMIWDIGSLGPSTSGSVTITGRLGSSGISNWPVYDPASNYISTGGSGPTTLNNTATIESSTASQVNSNTVSNSVTQYCGLTMPANILGYIKSSTNTEIYYLITLTNTGNITDKYDLTKTFSGTNLNTFIETVQGVSLTQTPWIFPNSSYSFVVRYVVPPGTGANDPDNITTVTATSFVCPTTTANTVVTTDIYGGQPPSGNNCDMQMSKTASPNPAVVGNNLVYTIAVVNTLPQNGNVTILDTLSTSLDFVSVTQSATSGLSTLTWTPTTRIIRATKNSHSSSDDPIIITLTVKPNCNGVPSVTNWATVSSSTSDINTSNDRASVTTTVNSNISAPTASGTTICQGATASLTASGAGGDYGYKWYDVVTGGIPVFTGNPFTTPNLNSTTTYYVSIYEIASPVCESSRTPVTVTVLATPAYTTQPTAQTICTGTNTSFSIAATGTLLSYQWQFSNDGGSNWSNLNNVPPYSGVTTTTLSLTNTPLGLNTYQYQCVIQTGTCTGVNSNSALLTVNPIPSCSISGPQSVFAGSNYTYTSTPVPNDNVNHLWSISGNGTINGSTTNATVSVDAGSAGTFTLTDNISRFGCTSSCTYNVTVVPACSITPTPASVANGTSTVYTAPVGMSTYSWSVTGNASIPSGITNQQTVTVLAGNTCNNYTLTLNLTINGATSNCSHTVSVTDNIPPTFTLPTLASGYCVESIYEAVFNDTPADPEVEDLTYLRPDYYIFEQGFTFLNLPSTSDNCTLAANPVSWTIDFGNNGSIDLIGTGQLQDYVPPLLVFPDRPERGIKFPLGTNRITYTVTDVAGNTKVQFIDLIVVPRPTIITNF